MPGVLRGVKYGDPIVVYRGEKVLKLAKRLSKLPSFMDLDLATDIYYSLYLPFPLVKPFNEVPEGKERNYYIIKELIESKEFPPLKSYTTVNSFMSTLLSASIVEYLVEELEEEGRSFGSGKEGSEEASEDRASVSRAVERALRRVKEEGKAVKQLQRILYTGREAGTGTVFDLDESGEDIIRLARNSDVTQLLKVISLIPKLTQRIRRKVERFVKGEVEGYELGGDLERLVPTELTLPGIYFKVKLAESKLLLYNKVLPKQLGPLYVLVDKCLSGDSLVVTREGLKEIRELRVGDEVLSVKLSSNPADITLTSAKVVSIYENGFTDILELRTSVGNLRVTGEHLIPVIIDGSVVEVRAGDLKVGDWLLFPKKLRFLRGNNLGAGIGYLLRQYSGSRDELLRLLGLLSRGSWRFNSSELQVKLPESVGKVIDRFLNNYSANLANAYHINGSVVISLEKKLTKTLTNLLGGRPSARSLVKELITLGSDDLREFMRGFFAAESLRALSGAKAEVSDNGAVTPLILLLLRLGILGRVTWRNNSPVIEVVNGVKNADSLREVNDEFIAVRVEGIKQGRGDTYDIMLERDHRFLANGFVVHNSGSMEGEKIIWAKVATIALFLRSRHEFRDFYVRFFDGMPHPLIKIHRKSKVSETISMIKYLSRVKGGGGTDITKAIVTACEDIGARRVREVSDIILITDGEDRVSERIISSKLRECNAKLITVMIMGENRDLRKLSHKYFRALRLSDKEILQVIEA